MNIDPITETQKNLKNNSTSSKNLIDQKRSILIFHFISTNFQEMSKLNSYENVKQ